MIAERLEAIALRTPDAVALIENETHISYHELIDRVETFARYLAREFGVRHGDTIGLLLPNCVHFVAAFFAAAKLGASCVPLNTRWKTPELREYIERFPVSAVLTNFGLAERCKPLGDLVAASKLAVVDEPELDEKLSRQPSAPAEPTRRPPSGDDIALRITTSGSTGRPRVTPRTHAAMLAGAANVGKAIGAHAGQSFLAVVPFYHSNGLSNSMFLPLMHGAVVVLVSSFDPIKFARIVRDNAVHTMVISPFILRIIADRKTPPSRFASVKVCLSSGAPTPLELTQTWIERYGIRVRQLYGSTETGTISIEPTDSPIRGGAVGVPVPEVEIRIVDGTGRNRPAGKVGEVLVRGPAMSSGYLSEPELNAELFVDGYFRTGDLGKIDAKGNLTIIGRKKKTINFGGIKVDPAEIEGVIEKMTQVRRCRVVGVLDRRQCEVIRAVIEVDSDRACSRRDVVAHCRQFLAEYKIPRIIEFVDTIPTDVTGKVALAWAPS